MTLCTEEQLIEALNRLDGDYKYVMDSWNLYHVGIKRPARKDRPEGWMSIKRKGIRGMPHDWPPSTRGQFVIEIEKDRVKLGHNKYKNRHIFFNKVKDIDDMARRIIRRIRNKEKVAVF